MHLVMLLLALYLAWYLRWQSVPHSGSWHQRWPRSLFLFLFPPLLLLTTALALLFMGPLGQMVRLWEGWFSYFLAVGFLGFAALVGLQLSIEGWHSLRQIRPLPTLDLEGQKARILNTKALFAAQIGFWRPELVLSQGLLDTLSSAHLQAVLAHEQGHYYYRDTFCFFWLGWVRKVTGWLPNTENLWQELLILRELRADAKAAQQVDSLLLAESLLLVVSAASMNSEIFCAEFSWVAPKNRLAQRIDALLAEPETAPVATPEIWTRLVLALVPLAVVPFHG